MKPFDFGDISRIHFVGIGGIGMSGIAEICLLSGYEVSGSDLCDSPLLERLRSLGAQINIGHRVSNIGDAQAVVYSHAISQENIELQTARTQKIPIIARGEMLAELMRFKKGITVSGTHGKTTTTAMLAFLLQKAGLDPTMVIGARFRTIGSNAYLGQGEFVVAETDESDRSFLKPWPVYAVVTNIDLDHMDEYKDLPDLQQAFLEHINRVPFYGAVVACWDDENLRSLLKKVHRPVITYGLSAKAEISGRNLKLEGLRSSFGLFWRNEFLGRITLEVPGQHNVLNSLAAAAMGLLLKVPFPVIQDALKAFPGAERRLEWKGDKKGVWVLDDYGHHPTEIRATLKACRDTGRRIVVVFQPHRYSRTLHLMKELSNCFESADLLYLLDIYSAGEEPITGVTSEGLAQEISRQHPVILVSDRDRLVRLLENATNAGDLLLTLGAGDVWKIGDAFLARNKQSNT